MKGRGRRVRCRLYSVGDCVNVKTCSRHLFSRAYQRNRVLTCEDGSEKPR